MQDATAAQTQSAPQTSQTQVNSYVAPQTAAQAPSVATSPQWVAPTTQQVAPAPQVQAQMGVQGYQSAPTAYSPQPQQATPAVEQGNYGYPQTTQFSNPAQQTYTPSNNSNQAYSNSYSQTSPEITDQQLLQNGVSEASLEVINHFGADAPAVLNNYACQIEDSLITTNQQLQEAVGLLQEMSQEHKAYEQILTDPDVLADYTCEFFGPEGPYPVEEENAAPAAPTFAGQQIQNPQIQAQAPVRPEMPVPPQPQTPADPGDFWKDFGGAADRDPQNAWRYLNAAQQNPEVFRQKLLVME